MVLRLAMLVAGSGAFAYLCIALLLPEEKKIKKIQGVAPNSVQVSTADIVRLAATSDKPLYKLSKKELDELVKAQAQDSKK